jgi:hypothetical protein
MTLKPPPGPPGFSPGPPMEQGIARVSRAPTPFRPHSARLNIHAGSGVTGSGEAYPRISAAMPNLRIQESCQRFYEHGRPLILENPSCPAAAPSKSRTSPAST